MAVPGHTRLGPPSAGHTSWHESIVLHPRSGRSASRLIFAFSLAVEGDKAAPGDREEIGGKQLRGAAATAATLGGWPLRQQRLPAQGTASERGAVPTQYRSGGSGARPVLKKGRCEPAQGDRRGRPGRAGPTPSEPFPFRNRAM